MDSSEFLAIALACSPLALLAYCWIVYPLLLSAMQRRTTWAEVPASDDPPITVLLVAHNAAGLLPGALEALIADDYECARRRILVVSDGSTDSTPQVVRAYRHHHVECLALRRRLGKTAAENLAWRRISGDYVICLDAGTRVAPGALRALVRALRQPEVGVASGVDSVVELGSRTGESAYVRVEMWVRELETLAGGIVGASGCLYGMRRSLFRPDLRPSLTRDFASVLEAHQRGLRAVSVGSARCRVAAARSLGQEYRRRVRTALQGLATLVAYRQLLNPRLSGGFAFRLASHKLARWIIPLTVPVALLAGVYLVGTAGVTLSGAVLALGFLMALATGVWRPLRYAALATVAVAHAWIGLITGRSIAHWTPTARPRDRHESRVHRTPMPEGSFRSQAITPAVTASTRE